MTKLPLTLIIAALFATACKTYTIPVDTFKKEYRNIDSSQMRIVTPTYGGKPYYINTWGSIHCFDKEHNEHILHNGPSIEVRFTYGPSNKRKVFYFDTIFLTDSTVSGLQSRFITSMRSSIPLASITRIEVQDGHKKWKYAEAK
jgi:hypothetical protein